jgi:hypothetical protein
MGREIEPRTEDGLIFQVIEQSRGGVVPTWIELTRHEANQYTPEKTEKLVRTLHGYLSEVSIGVYIFPEIPQESQLSSMIAPMAGVIVVSTETNPPALSEKILVLYEGNDGKNKIKYVPKNQLVAGLEELAGSLSGGKRIIPLVPYNPFGPQRD